MSFEELLDLFKNCSIPLSTQCSQNNSEEITFLRDLDLFKPDFLHLLCSVDFVGQLLLKGIVLIESQMWVSDHT